MRKNPIRRVLVATVALLTVSFSATAQEQRITLPAGKLSAAEVFDQIQRQTDYMIAASNDRTAGLTVQVASSPVAVKAVLAGLLQGSGLNYRLEGNYIIIQQSREPEKTVIQTMPAVRGSDTYARTGLDTHNNVNRRRPAPVIRIMDTTLVVPDKVFKNSDSQSSYIVPVESYMQNRLPRFALKTNLLHGLATLTPNLGIEFGLGRRTSLEIHGALNPWNLQSRTENNNKKLAHVFVRPEFRYWLCERFNGHFFGAHAFFGQYNIGSHDIPLLFEKEYRYDGTVYGAGVTYGYLLPLGKRWGIEFNIGVGIAKLDYDRFACTACERSSVPGSKLYFGPTRAGITLVFNIK